MTDPVSGNLLCYGDNLGFLTDPSLLPNESVDLIYLDPPFNSQQDYNVLFKEASGIKAAAQIKAFKDTWTWDAAANDALARISTLDSAVPAPLIELTRTFMNFLKPSPMSAYLVQMAIRLVHMHRVLKPTGSLYLHCDPTASHYLKMVLDAIFGLPNFRNEIIWKRSHGHNSALRLGPNHDCIFFYGKSDKTTWNRVYQEYDPQYIAKHYRHTDSDGRRFKHENPTGAGVRHGLTGLPWRGIDPTPKKRHWVCPPEDLDRLDALGLIHWPKKQGAWPYIKIYLEDMKGVPAQEIWDDIPPINMMAKERMGYPTQKPLALLQRIVSASSNPGDVILDPFCGCGTTIDAVETLNRENPDKPPRRWIGIDITHLSINLIKHRLTRFSPPPTYEIIGEPASVSAAEALAQHDPYQFQFWALGLIGARPVGGKKKKGADQGIDGVRYFSDESKGGALVTKAMLVQVKSGNVGAKDIRDLAGTLGREKAELGVFLTLGEPTKPMRTEAAAAGTYISPWNNQAYPRIQILTVGELLKDSHRPNPACLQIPGGTAQHTLPEPERHRRGGKAGELF